MITSHCSINHSEKTFFSVTLPDKHYVFYLYASEWQFIVSRRMKY